MFFLTTQKLDTLDSVRDSEDLIICMFGTTVSIRHWVIDIFHLLIIAKYYFQLFCLPDQRSEKEYDGKVSWGPVVGYNSGGDSFYHKIPTLTIV